VNVCVSPEKGRLCAECGGRAVILSGGWPDALPVRDCSMGHIAAKKNGWCSMVDSSISHVSVLKKSMLAVP
jgi:hypothetical protein